ncbi:protein phosphatase 1 regulatory subunit 15A isoform X2 [Tupaia chinensis]|uniref:protein phosphatase 1 regulatory subunit 15A isoform X2 n=1 Tax=Tupaia chinensis TaxID=246437 RepID=UPI000FFC9A7D|nr:protein phosphatase 1 regulatory subunit 15A isoform X2 [Tupaia chinensis]
MAPGQVPYQATSWRDAHPFFLLSPLMGFLSRAWGRLRGPGPPEPWLVGAIMGTDDVEAGLEVKAEAPLAAHCALGNRHHRGQADHSRAPGEDGEASWGVCLDQKADSPLLGAWGHSDDDDEEYSEDAALSVPRGWVSGHRDGQPARLPPSPPIRTLQASDKNPGEEAAEEEGVAEDRGVTKFSYPVSHCECWPGVGEEDGDAVEKEAPGTPPSPFFPGSKPSTWVYCPGEGTDQATEEEKKPGNREAQKSSIAPSSSASKLRAWEYRPGEESEDDDEKAHGAAEKGQAGPEPHSPVPAQRLLHGAWEDQPRENTEEKDDEDKDNPVGVAEKEEGAEGSFSIPPSTSAFLKNWVCRPGEDTEEEEDEDSESEWAEEDGEAEVSSSTPPTGAFSKAWVCRPGEDTEEEEEDEDRESEWAEEDGEAEVSSSAPTAGAFLKAWVYRPGEDTEEEEEEEEQEEEEDHNNDNKGDDSGAADWALGPSLQAQHALRGWLDHPGEETEEEEAAEEWGEAEPCHFRVAFYLPGQKPPPPWTPPKLPGRLQRRLRFSEPRTWDPDPETPLKARKVRFSEKVTVHFLTVWAGPAQAARRGPWEEFARDRSRFARRIAQAQEELGPYLTPAARARAWTRLRNPPASLAPPPAPPDTLASSPAQATPLSHAVATPSPSPPGSPESPSLDLDGRRG